MSVLAPVVEPQSLPSTPARSPTRGRTREHVMWAPVDVATWEECINRIFHWADNRDSRTVCACNVHSLVTARRDTAHQRILRSADLVTPDGAPVAWMLCKKGHAGQQRIDGPDLMWRCCQKAAQTGTEIFLYGSTAATLQQLQGRLRAAFPGLRVVGAFAPGFGRTTADEDAAIVNMINRSGARIVWVGLGCPKQEAWMEAHRGRVNAVMIGVGAAFDFHAGVVKRSPIWMQHHGFEWLHRLIQDPQRLASRYLVSNGIFLMAALPALMLLHKRR